MCSASLKVKGLFFLVLFALTCSKEEESKVLFQPRQRVVLFLSSQAFLIRLRPAVLLCILPLGCGHGHPSCPQDTMDLWSLLGADKGMWVVLAQCFCGGRASRALGSCLFCGRGCGFQEHVPGWAGSFYQRPRSSMGRFWSPAARPGVPEGCLQTLGQIKWLPGLDDSGPGFLPCPCSGL